MKQLIYRIIYNQSGNKVLRSINKLLASVLPDKIKISPSGTIQLSNKEGRILKIKTNQTSYITYLLYWKGYLNFEFTNIFIKLIKKVSVFYDIGANIGYYSLLAEWENKDIQVVGFEPATGPLFYFKENIRINRFLNIKVESLALSHQESEITFYEVQNKKYTYLQYNLAGEGNAGSKTAGRNFVPHKVKTTTLNQYVKDFEKKNIDLIKMDTEGTEYLILEQANYILKEMKPIIICETLFNTIEEELESIFVLYGYEFYNHTDDGLKKVDSIKREKDNGVRNCFFVHPTKFKLIEEFVK
jgi:FkbM family methyltransferase